VLAVQIIHKIQSSLNRLGTEGLTHGRSYALLSPSAGRATFLESMKRHISPHYNHV
jgi:hypothetical protein